MHVIAIDDDAGLGRGRFRSGRVDIDDVSHLQYTSGSTRPPVGVEITHRAVGTNLLQMILSIDLLDRNTHGVSWLPLYHDMGLSMIGFPAVYGGHSTLMSPTAFIRRPQRWIRALSEGRARAAWSLRRRTSPSSTRSQRGLPAPGEEVDLSNVVMHHRLRAGQHRCDHAFNAAFAPYGLPPTAIKPSYGIAEATLFVSTICPSARATVAHFDRGRLAEGHAVRVAASAAGARRTGVVRSRSPAVNGPSSSTPMPPPNLPTDGSARSGCTATTFPPRYWGRPEESRQTFDGTLQSRLQWKPCRRRHRSAEHGCAPEISGCYFDAELYVTGQRADHDHRSTDYKHYPQDIEATTRPPRRSCAGDTSRPSLPPPTAVARHHCRTRFGHPPGRSFTRGRRHPRRTSLHVHGLAVSDVRFVPAGAIPRTTSGKLARRACRADHLRGQFGWTPRPPLESCPRWVEGGGGRRGGVGSRRGGLRWRALDCGGGVDESRGLAGEAGMGVGRGEGGEGESISLGGVVSGEWDPVLGGCRGKILDRGSIRYDGIGAFPGVQGGTGGGGGGGG